MHYIRPLPQTSKIGASRIRLLRALRAPPMRLRQGRPVRLEGRRNVYDAGGGNPGRGGHRRLRRARALLVLSHARARTLKIRLYTPDVVALPLDAGMTAERIRAIADPTADLATPLKGPFEPVREKLPEAFAASVKLAKLAGLLPAAVLRKAQRETRRRGRFVCATSSPMKRTAAASLKLVTRARVPLEGAEQTELVAFRAGDGAPENIAIVIDRPPTPGPVLARLHSECFTGDLLGSLKCDCGAQLRGAIETISKAGGGVLLYLAQEGRGIGLINKLRAYRLQDQGFDTIEANERLGFEADERLYAIAARMLELLGYKSVRLLTNNPDKVAASKAAGIEVAERVRHAFPGNEHNRAYLRTKAEKAGHLSLTGKICRGPAPRTSEFRPCRLARRLLVGRHDGDRLSPAMRRTRRRRALRPRSPPRRVPTVRAFRSATCSTSSIRCSTSRSSRRFIAPSPATRSARRRRSQVTRCTAASSASSLRSRTPPFRRSPARMSATRCWRFWTGDDTTQTASTSTPTKVANAQTVTASGAAQPSASPATVTPASAVSAPDISALLTSLSRKGVDADMATRAAYAYRQAIGLTAPAQLTPAY